MNRDLNRLRALMLKIEAAPSVLQIEATGDDQEDRAVFYHAGLLAEAGFAESVDASTSRYTRKNLLLTWRGLEFLDLVRSDATWALLNDRLPIQAGEVPVSVVERYAYQLAMQQVTPMSP